MPVNDSVSRWLGDLKEGDAEAARKLWERYFRRLVGLAHTQLQNRSRRVADEEDVALTAFASFCRGVEQGKFPRLENRNDLWKVLVVLTARKAKRLARYQDCKKRSAAQEDWTTALEEIISDEPTPAFAAEMADECQRLLAKLDDIQLTTVAVARMEGYTNAEIARKLGCSPRTVERKLELIRDIWQDEPTP